jgi:hypothetical protein
LLFRLRCFDFASPQKVPNGSSTVAAFANRTPNRQINFLFGEMQRFCIPEKRQDFRAFPRCGHISAYFLSAACAAARRATGTRNGEQET